MKKIINSAKAPQAIGPYSQAVEVNGTLYVSGQIPVDAQTGNFSSNIAEQTEQVMKNIGYILEEANYSFNDIVKTTIFITDMADFGAINEVYGKYFTADKPARACFQVCALPKGVNVEVEAIASK